VRGEEGREGKEEKGQESRGQATEGRNGDYVDQKGVSMPINDELGHP